MIYIDDLVWDDGNLDHIEERRIKFDEVEEAISQRLHAFKHREKLVVIGKTEGGRYITVVLEHKGDGMWRPVTARQSDDKEVKLTKRQGALKGAK